MRAIVDGIYLNSICHPKKVKGEFYYTLSFLDNDDNSYNCFISEDLHNSIERMKLRRFAPISIEMSIYKNRDGNYMFTPMNVDTVPFETEEEKKHAGK